MKNLIALSLILSLLFTSAYSLISCAGGEPVPEPAPAPEPSDNDTVSVIKPPYRDYGRGTVDFGELEYRRPDITAISDGILAVAADIADGTLGFDAEVERIESIEDGYITVVSMYTLAELGNMKNSSDAFWHAEYEYMSVGYSRFTDALEAMFVACAESENRERFENEYFGYSLEDYADGEIYTERAVELLSREAELEAEYSALSTSSIEITYLGKTDTVDNILKGLRESYGADSAIYASAYGDCMELYYEEESRMGGELFLELLSLRALIADELGYDSYTDYAYEIMGHDYSARDMMGLLSDMKDSVYPVFSRLYTRVFNGYFRDADFGQLDTASALNTLYALFGELDPGISEAYSYMLQHNLYDVGDAQSGRFDGSFTTYIESNSSPYLFVTNGGTLTDYATLAHEFGHFYDGYVNFGVDASLDVAEISSQGLELLTVERLSGVLTEEEHRLLEYYETYSILNVLLIQGFFSAFEHYVYKLEYGEINRERVNEAVARASELIFGSAIYNDLSAVLIPHTVLYPHYVQSYCTSAISALEIYFLECDTEGAGIGVYTQLVLRDGEYGLGYSEMLEAVGLTSPFKDGALRGVCDRIHYQILGSHYFKEQEEGNGVGAA
ncbi:MAG: hypothetical protein IJW48_03345 [Clostridia bacterium]|nr:hypothetical protein [Clostridia bacterium]